MTVRGVLAGMAIAVGGAAGGESIVVTPSAPQAGQKIHLSVPGCSTGPTPHTATSDAFTSTVPLYGKADTGDADAVLRQDLKPGTYPITAHCGASTVEGQIAVAGPVAPHHRGPSPEYWLIAAVALILAALAGTVVRRRRRRTRTEVS
jgi:hypothetical protein